MQSHVFTCIHYLVVGTSGYCWMQVYHRYVLGLYRIFEARMNCDRGTALCWPVMAGDHFQLSPRPLRELCVCDLSENMDELNRFQMEVEQSSAWYIFDIIWHFESFWCIRSFVRFIVMFLHSAVGLERSGGGRFDAALLAWCPQVHNRKLLTRLTTFRIHQNSICGYLQPLYVDRWPLMTLCIYIHIHMIICIYIYIYICMSETVFVTSFLLFLLVFAGLVLGQFGCFFANAHPDGHINVGRDACHLRHFEAFCDTQNSVSLRPQCDVWVPTSQHAQFSAEYMEFGWDWQRTWLEAASKLVHFEAVCFKAYNNLRIQWVSISCNIFSVSVLFSFLSQKGFCAEVPAIKPTGRRSDAIGLRGTRCLVATILGVEKKIRKSTHGFCMFLLKENEEKLSSAAWT